jgi:hypothetical protein
MPNYLKTCLKKSSNRNLFRSLSLLCITAAVILLRCRALELHAGGEKWYHTLAFQQWNVRCWKPLPKQRSEERVCAIVIVNCSHEFSKESNKSYYHSKHSHTQSRENTNCMATIQHSSTVLLCAGSRHPIQRRAWRRRREFVELYLHSAIHLRGMAHNYAWKQLIYRGNWTYPVS